MTLSSHSPQSAIRNPQFLCLFLAFLTACSIHRLEVSKSYYQQAREAQEAGNDLEAVLAWKNVLAQSEREIAAGHYLTTNYFLRASAHFELGNWDQGFADLKQISPESLSKEELWIYPLYAVQMGDYYAQKSMPLIARNFYESVLKKSNLKSSSIYLLALERQCNNSIRVINEGASGQKDPEAWKVKQYEDLSKDLQKYIEDFPFRSVPHYLMGDLYLKQGRSEEALQYLMAALEMELPTHDLKTSTEFDIAALLLNYRITGNLRTSLLSRAQDWWADSKDSLLAAGENTSDWAKAEAGLDADLPAGSRIRYIAVMKEGKPKILIWEKL